MGKKIAFTYDGVDYTLRYTKRTVAALEDKGVSLANLDEPSVKNMLLVFNGAFEADHPDTKDDVKEEILDHIGDTKQVLTELYDMIAEQINALAGESDEDDAKNIVWTVSK